jgi:hypothetical protein
MVFRDLAVHCATTLIAQLFADRAFEETLATFATDRSIVAARGSISTNQTKFYIGGILLLLLLLLLKLQLLQFTHLLLLLHFHLETHLANLLLLRIHIHLYIHLRSTKIDELSTF